MDPAAITLTILAVAVVAFLSNRVPLGVVALGVALSLFFTGVLTLPEALAGFGDPTVVFIAALFVVSEALDASGVTLWVGQQVITHAGRRRSRLVVIVSAIVAVLTALISINGAVAALLPLVVVVAARSGIASSQLLIPLAFAAHAGSLLTLTGTPVNIIVSDLAAEHGGRSFGYFEFALVGLPLLAATVLVVLLLGRRLLPAHESHAQPTDLRRLLGSFREDYALSQDTGALLGPDRGVLEVLVAPRSPFIGLHVFPGMHTPDGGIVVLGARRGDAPLEGRDARLEVGDALLLNGGWDDLHRQTERDGVVPVHDPQALRRSIPLGRGAKRAIVVLATMVVLLASGIVPAAAAALLAALALVVTRTVTAAQAYRSISWTTIVLIAGMIPLSTAFQTTGAADLVAAILLDAIGAAGHHVALLAICLVTLVLGQLISNAATVLVVAPVAISVAAAMDVSALPFLMALTVAGAAAFLTPIATPANMMVFEPGGYRFGDYWRLGLPLALLFLAAAVLYVPLIWPF